HSPRGRPRSDVAILDVGCGAGNNLWFAAREGFLVAGIDASPTAIGYARKRLVEDGLDGDVRVGDFTRLPWNDSSFDLAIDRGAIVCCGRAAGRAAVREVRRVLRAGGRFLFNPYSARHSSHRFSEPGPDDVRVNISAGNLTGVGQICFYNRPDVEGALRDGWKILTMDHLELVDEGSGDRMVHAEWRVVAERLG